MKRLLKDALCVFLAVLLTGTFLAAATDGIFTELADSPVFSLTEWFSGALGAERAAGTPSSISGVYTSGENTREELISLWDTIAAPYSGSVYKVTPSVVSPYSTGTLEPGYLTDVTAYLNFYRKVAKMPQLTLSNDKCLSSQFGAVLLAANDASNHSPPKPSDMTDDFYAKGCDSTGKSCIAKSSYYPGGIVMRAFIDACFDDSTADYYLEHVVHRRWFLSPDLKEIGFGQATATSGNIYTTAPVVADYDDSIAYDYIAWPSSGWFPTELINSSESWNIMLNPEKFSFSATAGPTVKLTRQSDGQVFNLTTADSTISTSTPFLSYDTTYYAVPMNITFHIGSANHLSSTLSGNFDVEISGIVDKSTGAAVKLSYTVKFFSLSDIIEPTTGDETSESGSVPSTSTTTTTTTTTTKPTTTVTTTYPRTLRSIKIASKPTKLSYNYKSTLDISGLALTATYSDNTSNTVTSGFACAPTYLDHTGTQKITVTYGGQTTSFDVTVKYAFYQYLILIFLFGFVWY